MRCLTSLKTAAKETMGFQVSFEYRSGIKAAAWTLENKMVKHIISLKLNSAFSTIGKATADKITAKIVGKTHISIVHFCIT